MIDLPVRALLPFKLLLDVRDFRHLHGARDDIFQASFRDIVDAHEPWSINCALSEDP